MQGAAKDRMTQKHTTRRGMLQKTWKTGRNNKGKKYGCRKQLVKTEIKSIYGALGRSFPSRDSCFKEPPIFHSMEKAYHPKPRPNYYYRRCSRCLSLLVLQPSYQSSLLASLSSPLHSLKTASLSFTKSQCSAFIGSANPQGNLRPMTPGS